MDKIVKVTDEGRVGADTHRISLDFDIYGIQCHIYDKGMEETAKLVEKALEEVKQQITKKYFTKD